MPSALVSRVARIPDLYWGSFWEGALILIVGVTAWASGHPWLFASLGPTAYEMAEKPELPSARPYNVVVGQFVGLGAGFAALAMFSAWNAPAVNGTSFLSPERLWAAVIAAFLTTIVNLLLRSGQPAALATTLLVSLGAMQTAGAALWIVVGVVILAVVGEPVRRIRLAAKQQRVQEEPNPLQPPKAA